MKSRERFIFRKQTIMPKLDKPKAPKRLGEYPREMRGPPQNRWGGQQTQRLRTYGGKFGKANNGRSLNADEIEHWKRENWL
jgi:hypothetical protein